MSQEQPTNNKLITLEDFCQIYREGFMSFHNGQLDNPYDEEKYSVQKAWVWTIGGGAAVQVYDIVFEDEYYNAHNKVDQIVIDSYFKGFDTGVQEFAKDNNHSTDKHCQEAYDLGYDDGKDLNKKSKSMLLLANLHEGNYPDDPVYKILYNKTKANNNEEKTTNDYRM